MPRSLRNPSFESLDTDEVTVGPSPLYIEAQNNDRGGISASSGFLNISPGDLANVKIQDGLIIGSGGVNIDNSGYTVSGPIGVEYLPQDVRNISAPSQGYVAYHDGSGSNTEGPAHYNGTDWISTVDGTTIN